MTGLNIRKIRTPQRISRTQLAYEIGTYEKQLARIEGGEINCGVLTYIKIANFLDSLPQFFGQSPQRVFA